MVNDNVSLISFSDSSLLAYRNGKDFCVLTLYPANLPNPLMSSSNFLVESLGFSMYSIISSVQSFSHVRLFATSWTAAHQASRSFTSSRCLLKLMSIELVMPFNHFTLYRPLLLLPSIFPSIKVFSNELALWIRWPKDWSFSLSVSPSSEYSGLISFRIDWLSLLVVQVTLKSLLQHHSSKTSILWCSDFFMVQLSLGKSPGEEGATEDEMFGWHH